MTQPPAIPPDPVVDESAPDRRGHILEALAWIQHHAPTEYEPAQIHTSQPSGADDRAVVEIVFPGPPGVIKWAKALGFDGPARRDSPELRQTIVESTGDVQGWCVVLRHIRTEPSRADTTPPGSQSNGRPR